MNHPRSKPNTKQGPSQEDLVGIWVKLDGGEEDTTIRPAKLSAQIRKELESDDNSSDLEDELDWDAH